MTYKEMEVSNSVQINGLVIGNVSAINEADKDLKGGIIVTILLKKDVHIPSNSVGEIIPGLISSSPSSSPGDDPQFLNDGDTLETKKKSNLLHSAG